MSARLLPHISHLLDVLLPPRPTERLMRILSLEEMHSLASTSGTLPYHEVHVRALVWEIKYRKNSEALAKAGAFLSEYALLIAEEALGKPVLVPVPMHAARRKARGFNQTEELCKAIIQATPNSFEYAPHALERVRNTLPQQGLPRHRRLKNILGAMEISDASEIKGKTCIVIDDVSTTGATAHETKRALIEGKAKKVHILTLAHS